MLESANGGMSIEYFGWYENSAVYWSTAGSSLWFACSGRLLVTDIESFVLCLSCGWAILS